MNPNLVITVLGSLSVLMGASVFFMSETIVKGAFVTRLINEQSIVVGSLMHEAMASVIVGMGVLMLLLRTVEAAVAKKILFAFAVAMTVSLAGALRHYMMPEVTPPLPALGLQAVMIGVAYYVSLKGKED
ncbi:MAG TPA: hypothetical protein EYN31_08180 [Candidatus Marinimicrobia bacterium]|nr:hypothetical protein [Candidatus Neomarinimicrobiota bacterium]